MPSTLLWFTNDLRVHDNAALEVASKHHQPLICLYCIDERLLKINQYGVKSIGEQRWRFLHESLQALNQSLVSLGQTLVICIGNPITVINQIIQQHSVNTIIRNQAAASDENKQWRYIQERNKGVTCHTTQTFTLFKREELSYHNNFPRTFSTFRRQLESLQPSFSSKKITDLPPPLSVTLAEKNLFHTTLGIPYSYAEDLSNPFQGGEINALKHVEHYFTTTAPSHYKETRNALEGWDSSCKFSPWLADGSISVRRLVDQLRQYEKVYGANDSTEWIYFELLWREYFQWYSYFFGNQLFLFKGIGTRKPLTSFYPQRFKQWSLGKTPWPIANACMAQLNQTGYLSNRGRQIVASCLVNELNLDWRCGASYFEHALIDYDPASNWGNWQYIAGVGADPRGGRHFNLEKQTQQYDPKQLFIKKWIKEEQNIHALDQFDAADWPI